MLQKSLVSVIFIFVFLCQCSATPHKRSMGEVVDDNVIHVKLDAKYMKDKIVPAKDVKIKVWKGVVTLTGRASTQRQIDRAIEIAEQQPGVTEVKAYLTLKDLPDRSDRLISKKTATSEKKSSRDQKVHEEDILEPKEKNSDTSEFGF